MESILKGSKAMSDLSAIEKTALAGYLLLGDADAAYQCINHDSTATGENLHRMALRWLRQPKSKDFLDSQRAILQSKATKKEAADPTDLTDRDNLLRELIIQYRSETTPKLKADILTKISDILNFKKLQDLKDEEKRVYYYLPRLECEGCPFGTDTEGTNTK